MGTSADVGTMVQAEGPATPPGAATPRTARNPLRWFVFAVVIAANIMDLTDATIVNVAGPSIRHALGGSASSLQWLPAGYTLAFAVFLITGARLGDRLGRRRLFLIGSAGFTVMSAACSAAPTMAALIAFRVLQGSFGALMVPQGFGMLKEVFDEDEMTKVFGAFGPMMGLSILAAPILAGALVEANLWGIGWRLVFLINVPIGIAAFAGGMRVLAVTVLTSLDESDLAQVGSIGPVPDLVKKRESRVDQREVLGAIIAEDITLAGTTHNPEAPKLKTKKARLALEREESELVVKEGDELTEEVFNRLRRLNIDKVKVFASYTTIDLRDEIDAIERGERPSRRIIAVDSVNPESGEVIADVGDSLTDTLIRKLRKNEINKVQVFVTSGRAESMLIKNTLAKDPTHTDEEALKQIYSLLRPGDAPNRETARQALERIVIGGSS